MAKVLLVEPNEDINNKGDATAFTPLGLIYLGTAIEEKHIVKIYDRNLNKSDSDFLDFFNKFNPDIVGFTSGMSAMLLDLIHLGRIIKKISQKTIIIVGGVAATSKPDLFLREPYIDYILRGEGEEAFLEFCDTFDNNPKSLGKLKNINKNSLRPFVDIDQLKLPNYGLVDINKYEGFYINLTRGCPGSCSFCYNCRMWGKEGKPFMRSYSLERTLALFEQIIKKYKRKVFLIVDDNFVSFKKRCLSVCNFLSKYKIHFYTSSRTDNLDDEIMIALKKAGCHTLLMGVESGSQKILDFLHKNITVQQNINAIRLCKKYKIISDASLMIGLPTETLEDLKKTISFVKDNTPDVANVHIYKPLPSPLLDYCISNGIFKEPSTLEGWADMGNIFHLNDNISEIPTEELKKALEELKNFQVYKRKIKRFFFWISIGEFKYVGKAIKLFIKEKIFKSRE